MKNMSKADKLRLASKVAWLISSAMTGLWVYSVLALTITEWYQALGLTIVIAAGFQYVISLVESALFDGSLPAPWSLDWSWEGSLPWLWGGAVVCLLVDVMLNLGGVSIFTNRLADTGIGQEQLELSSEFVQGVSKFATFVLAALFAVAPELLDEFAVYLETGASRAMQLRAQRQKAFVQAQRELGNLLEKQDLEVVRGQKSGTHH